MRLVEIADRSILLELDPEDALRIAQACALAVERDGTTDTSIDLFEIFVTAFEGMALAAIARSYTEERFAGHLTMSYMRENMLRRHDERTTPLGKPLASWQNRRPAS